jgi:putative hydrolase of the HAD superfamily
MAYTKYKHIIFDIGGVLLYWKPLEIAQDIFGNNKQFPKETLNKTILDMTQSKTWQHLDRGTRSLEQVIMQLSKTYDPNIVRPFLENIPKYLTPIQSGLDLFHKVKQNGYNRLILSNMSKEYTDKAVIKNDFYKDNDGIILSYRISQIKPEPEIYQTLLTTYNLNPNDCLFIDDSEKNIIAAKKMGIDGIVCSSLQCVWDKCKKLGILE